MSSDTGGGHRASSMALAKQFSEIDPSINSELYDIWTQHGVRPYKNLVQNYIYLSAHPRWWRFLYHLSNSAPFCTFMNWHSNITGYRKVYRALEKMNPDVIISVHPTMTNTPQLIVKELKKRTSKTIPIFTVCTDLGSGHATWFTRRTEKVFVASDRIRRLGLVRGWLRKSQIVDAGLPIRAAFGETKEGMGARGTDGARAFQEQTRKALGVLPELLDKPVVLVMGGGEGVGMLSEIVDASYLKLKEDGVDATILVICGRNAVLKDDLNSRDWATTPPLKEKGRVRKWWRKWRATKYSKIQYDFVAPPSPKPDATVNVKGIGFVTNIDEYMAASSFIVTKAGPGTIAESAVMGLPILLTSFLPGQEAGNVNVVIDNGYGDYNRDPATIGKIVSVWARDASMMAAMSPKAEADGVPNAARDIAATIYERVIEARDDNEARGVRANPSNSAARPFQRYYDKYWFMDEKAPK